MHKRSGGKVECDQERTNWNIDIKKNCDLYVKRNIFHPQLGQSEVQFLGGPW